MKEKITIYTAASLFNARETYFNSRLVEGLEKLDYKTNFPQRDGFEFENLQKALTGKVSQVEINSAVQKIIYFLDLGQFIPKSDVILANFDEPIDEGVIVETSYARLMGKYVIGFRTDLRSPYGVSKENFGGMHTFPAYQADKFISYHMSARDPYEREHQMNSLVQIIHKAIEKEDFSDRKIPRYARRNPNISSIIDGARILFKGIQDIHSEKGLEEIAQRYTKHRSELI